MGDLIRDFRFAARRLIRRPGFTVIIVAVLALAIGLNTAVFSVVHLLLIRLLPYHDPERLVVVMDMHKQRGYGGASYDNFLDWTRDTNAFEKTSLLTTAPCRFEGIEGRRLSGLDEAEEIVAARVTTGFFPMLGVRPRMGRWFFQDEETPGRDDVAILAHAAWRRWFGGATDVVGRSLRLNGKKHTVVGVMPSGFHFNYGAIVDLWTPFVRQPEGRLTRRYATLARLKRGVSIAEAQEQLDVVARRLERQYPETNANWGYSVVPMRHASDFAGPEINAAVLLAFAASGVVFLIACLNVAGLLLARSISRAREIAVRSALGASRFRVVRLALVESLLLSFCGAAFGLAVAYWCMGAVSGIVPSYLNPRAMLSVDLVVVSFAVFASLLAAAFFGVAPALRTSRLGAGEILKQDSGSAGLVVRRARFLSALVVVEIALALTLMTAAGLFLRSLRNLMTLPLGYRTADLLIMKLNLPEEKYRASRRIVRFHDELTGRVQRLAGVVTCAVGESPPLSDVYTPVFVLREGRPEPEDPRSIRGLGHSVTTEYFRTLGITLRRGRVFGPQDGEASEPVAIVSEALVRRDWPDEDPVGRSIRVDGTWRRVVGIVSDVRHRGPMAKRIDHDVYVPHTQAPGRTVCLIVHAEADALRLAASVRAQIKEIDRDVLVRKAVTISAAVKESTAELRALTGWILGFGMVALVLATMGLFGVMAFSAAQRTRELGVRMALGARRRDIVSLVVRRGLALASIGAALGLGAAYAATRALSSLLHGVRPEDPMTYGAASLVIGLTAFLASYLPARRASRIDPMEALRCE
ncbi:MAG: ABC transporter permease [Vicinamibacteria bacterium]|nr:ABC transporter permease [Vicinamibacteria bacterium]